MKKNYKAIRTWGDMMGSMQYYIDRQVAQAEADDAPEDAIYRNDDGTWSRLSEVTYPATLDYFRTRGFNV